MTLPVFSMTMVNVTLESPLTVEGLTDLSTTKDGDCTAEAVTESSTGESGVPPGPSADAVTVLTI